MNKQSLLFTGVVAIIAISLMLMAIQIFAKKLKIKPESDQKINISYSFWFGSLLISFILILKTALDLLENSIELIIYSKTIDNVFIAIMEKISIFIGFSFLFTFLAYLIVQYILKFSIGSRVDEIEIEKDNIGYYLIKGLLLIFLVISLASIFEHFLRWFMPIVETPFYH